MFASECWTLATDAEALLMVYPVQVLDDGQLPCW